MMIPVGEDRSCDKNLEEGYILFPSVISCMER